MATVTLSVTTVVIDTMSSAISIQNALNAGNNITAYDVNIVPISNTKANVIMVWN